MKPYLINLAIFWILAFIGSMFLKGWTFFAFSLIVGAGIPFLTYRFVPWVYRK